MTVNSSDKKTIYALVFAMLLNVSAVVAQSTIDTVKAVVNAMFDAMRRADAASFRKCFSDSAVVQTIAKPITGASVRSDQLNSIATFLEKGKAGDADERIRFDAIHIDGDLASVLTYYHFYYKGIFSHCGVNSFQLVRFASGWKIQHLIDTRRKNNCEGSFK